MEKYGKICPNSNNKFARKLYESETQDWDKKIDKVYFDLMREVSKNQIIFGGNYYADILPASSCWIVWDKLNGDNDFADCELAWTSLNSAVRICRYLWNGYQQGNMKNKQERIHPTEKAIPVLEWILNKYTKEGDTILDPFAGSLTLAIACHKLKRQYICCEKDKVYFEKGLKRLNEFKAQISIFDIL